MSDPVIRSATAEDGAGVWRVVRDSQVLDVNSSYAYLLFLDHFGHTSVVAEHEGRVVGFVTGFRPPREPEAIFVWQVAVDESMRGRGLARRLLDELVRLPGCDGVRTMLTTVTPSNAPSQALFRSFARGVGAEVSVSPCFEADHFPEGGHEPEELYEIGPFDVDRITPSTPRSPSPSQEGKGTPPPSPRSANDD